MFLNRSLYQLLFHKTSGVVAVVIPIYKVKPTKEEWISFTKCVDVLGAHPIYIIAPEGLDLTEYCSFYPACQVLHFLPNYFKSIEGYNRLLLSEQFFAAFMQYHYMLIHQLDCYVFRDELDWWCQQGYDYIGAPWMDADPNHEFQPDQMYRKFRERLKANSVAYRSIVPRLKKFSFQRVGNGGLSLRNVQFSLLMLKLFKGYAARWRSHEDLFWSIAVPNLYPFCKVPDQRMAMAFAVETQPSHCYQLLDWKLPFGCHAWRKFEPDFWEQFIPQSIT
jgi:hypothetical protein